MTKENVQTFLTELAQLTAKYGLEISGGNVVEFERRDGSYSVGENIQFDY